MSGARKRAFILLFTFPQQEADGQIECIRAAFLKGSLRLSVDIDRSTGEFLSRQVDKDLPLLERIPGVFFRDHLTGTLPMKCLVLPLSRRPWDRLDRDPGSLGQLVFQQSWCLADKAQTRFRGPVIEERIPRREVQ